MNAKSSDNSLPSDAYEAGYETHDVNIPYIVGFAAICIIFIVLGIFMVDNYFVYTKEKLVEDANRVQPKALVELRAQEQQKLSTYGVINDKEAIYRIPISRAMKLLSEESFENSRP